LERGVRKLLAGMLLAFAMQSSLAQEWIIASASSRAEAGARFEIVVVAPAGEALPDELPVRLRADIAEVDLTMKAAAPAQEGRRAYAATMPAFAGGPVTLQLVERSSNTLALVVSRGDALQATLAGFTGAEGPEPPLSENEPMYFIVGTRGPTTARFQISLKYRLFDATSGFGQGQPWLSGLYFGYTQNSLWDLSTESKAFRDTSYRPSVFWKWERPDRRTFFDGARLGLEHESNGGEGSESRSINIAFVRPEWHWELSGGGRLAFTPKFYSYLDKEENTDIDDYRGYADWRVRYDSGHLWIATGVLRYGTAGKGSVQIDLSRRTRDLKFGPVSGYLHIQFFAGYGEDIVDYNVRNKSQLRIGFAIVP
jgi:outer membrane phospholipase A